MVQEPTRFAYFNDPAKTVRYAACRAVVEQTDLSEERGAAVFRAALAALREAERRRAASL
jgi:hypothetical protein